MSRRGNCWDNAVVERFFRSLKNEWIGEPVVRRSPAMQSKTSLIIWSIFYNPSPASLGCEGTAAARFEALAAYPGAVSKVA
ncbi:integrase core domain-containing protein [Burkholderia pseudomallei]|uniref:integrase core domain-containing protein n=1 Tax=Burkholderia pseudomallei TaxID=28450 RepID=UPI000ABB9D22